MINIHYIESNDIMFSLKKNNSLYHKSMADIIFEASQPNGNRRLYIADMLR